MKLCWIVVTLAACLHAPAFGQRDASVRLTPITAPLRHAGVLHVATGTWTRNASLASLTGPDTIYNNTCAPLYYVGMLSTEAFQHRSRIPSTSSPITPTITPGRPATDLDSTRGCANAYLVNGFQIAYCSSAAPKDWRFEFASTYTDCDRSDMLPQYTVDVPGLPGGSLTTGRCWIVDIDLSGGSAGGILLSADGDGTYDGTPDTDEFGYAFHPLSPTSPNENTGPIIAGEFTWTGGAHHQHVTPCTGTDGTIWDNPIDLTEEGTGMGSLDFFRDAGTAVSGPSGPGCYDFGGIPHADFWLELYADTGCPPPDPMLEFCFPNAGGTRSCPCGNPPSPNDGTRGCNNYGPTPPGGTGGAILTGSGYAVASTANSLVFHVAQMQSPCTLVLLLSGSTKLSPGLQSGAGVRCVAGIQTPRPYKSIAGFNASSIDFPSANATPNADAWTRSNSPPPGTTRHYYAAYRNPAAGSHAPCSPSNAFNLTNAGSITWHL